MPDIRSHLFGAGLALWMMGCASTTLQAPPLVPHQASGPTQLTLPPLGKVHGDRLVDGDPVWVVRTPDDQVRVFSARVRMLRQGRVEHTVVVYDPDCTCFRAEAPVIWGLDGTITARARLEDPNGVLGLRSHYDGATAFWLDRYDVERVGDRVTVKSRWQATERVRARDRLSKTVRDAPGPKAECALRPGSAKRVSAAMSASEGTMVLIGANVVRGRLCETKECADDGPPVYDATGSTDPMPGPILARRFRDGFVSASTHRCHGFTTRCGPPGHDVSWLTTPVGKTEGIRIDAPVACTERKVPNVRMIRVHGRGSKPLDWASTKKQKTGFYPSIFRATKELGMDASFGIGACFETNRQTQGRLVVAVHDWRHVDAAIRMVHGELDRWDIKGAFWVSVEPYMCGTLLGSVLPGK